MKRLTAYIFLLFVLTTMHVCQAQEQGSASASPALDGQKTIGNNTIAKAGLQGNALGEGLKQADEMVRQGRYDIAMQLYEQLLEHTPPDSKHRTEIYSQMANLQNYAGNYEAALKLYYNALRNTADKEVQAEIHVNMSASYIDMKNYDKAMQSLDDVIELLKNGQHGYWMALALSNKGSIYNARNQYREAITEFRKAYAAAGSGLYKHGKQRADSMDIKCLALNNLADSYMKLGKPDSAVQYLSLAMADFNLLSQYSRCCVLITLGEIYSETGKYALALQYLQQGKNIAELCRYQVFANSVYASLAQVYSKMGKYKEAWDYQKKHTALNDSLTSMENIHKINNLERQYDLSVRDKELAQKELMINKQAGHLKAQYQLAAILVLVLVSLGIILLISRRNYRNRRKLLQEQLASSVKDRKIMQIEAGLKGEEKERTRIAGDLHDGVVSELLAMKLNLQALGKEHLDLKQSEDFRNIMYQAEEVTEKLRKAAHNLMPAALQGNGLIDTIAAFLKRINNHKIQFTFQHYGNIPEFSELTGKIILMITMELIQNILKHSRATEAIIQFDFFPDNISITVEDNGVGIGNGRIADKGIGLNNVDSNVTLLNGSIDIKSSEYTGTTILIEVPCHADFIQQA